MANDAKKEAAHRDVGLLFGHLLEDIPALKDLFHIEPVALAMCTFQISKPSG